MSNVADWSRVESYPQLFSPLRLGCQRFRNRIAFASMFSVRARNGEVTPELIRFYANRAMGGASLIVSEAMSVLRHSPIFGAQIRLYQRKDLSGLQRWTDAVRSFDSGIIGQLQESGRADMRPQRKPFSMAPSALPCDLSWTMPRAMTKADIDMTRDDFVAAAQILKNAGFNGMELSSGHGHLLHQFLSPWMNQREDEYGGTRENRIRFFVELIDEVRATCGPKFLVGIRLPGNDGIPQSIDWQEAAQIADALTKACRLDYVNFVQGAHAWTLHMHVPDLHTPRGTYVDEIGKLRPACNGVPVASTGRIVEPGQAEALLAAGKADFVMLGRTLIADPAWGLKARQNRDGEIRKCLSCNHCWREAVQGKPLNCDNNPRVALPGEVDFWPKPARFTRRLTVVGGGVAGLETAWIAAARGHKVTLFSQSGALGGKARLYASLPGCEAASSIFDYQIAAAQRAGVQLELSHAADAADILATAPDAVVIATGGEMLWPSHFPREWREWDVVRDLWSAITNLPRMQQDKSTAVLYDFEGTDVTYATAEALSHRFARVVILNPVECLARDEALVDRQAIYRRLLSRGVETMQWSEVSGHSAIESGRIVVRNILSERESVIEDVGLLVYATPRRSRNELMTALRGQDFETHLIGDAYLPRTSMLIVREAHELGEKLFTVSPAQAADRPPATRASSLNSTA
jgi:dimethylglycine catabolism A